MTPEEILKDPDFHGLPQAEQLKVLSTVDPDFAALPGGEQIKVIAGLGKMEVPKSEPQATQPQGPSDAAFNLMPFQPGNIVSAETLKEQLPVAGGMLGGLAKANPLTPLVSGMGTAAGALMAGQGGEPTGPTDIPDATAASLNQFNAPVGAFVSGAGADLGGQMAFGAAKKVLAPYAKSFADRLATIPEARIAQDMVEQGVPLSPGGYQPTRMSRAFQWIADNFMPGNLIVNKRRQEVADAILKMRQDFITSEMGLPEFTKSIPQAQAKTRELFSQFVEQAGGKEATIPMPNTVNYIIENMGKDITSSDQWWTKKFVPWMKKGEDKTVDQINTIHATYNRSWNKLTPAQKDLRNGLRESIYKDLAAHDVESGLQLEEAIKTAQTAAKEPKDIAKARWVENALLDPATKIEDQSYVFYPAQFKTQVDKNVTKIEQMFGQEGVDTFNKFADKMMLAAPDMGKLNKVSDATALMRKATGLGMLSIPGAVAAGNPAIAAGLAVPYGSQVFIAKSLMNPEGWLRKWLTTGVKPPTLLGKEAPKLGILEATQ